MINKVLGKRGARIVLSIAVLLVTAIGVSAQGLPGSLALVPGKVVIENCNYAAGAALTNLSGSGTLKISVPVPGRTHQYSFGAVNFTSLAADASGQITGGSLTIPAKAFSDFFGSGMVLDIKSGTVSVKREASVTSAIFDLKIVIATPFNDLLGQPFKVDLQTGDTKLIIDSTGKMDLACTLGKPFTSGGVALGFQAAGFKIVPSDVTLQCSASLTQPFKFTLSCMSGVAATNLPGLLVGEDSKLVMQFNPTPQMKPGLSIDQDGMINIPSLRLYVGSGAAAGGSSGGSGTAAAGISGVSTTVSQTQSQTAQMLGQLAAQMSAASSSTSATASAPIEIPLTNPLDFTLRIKQADVTVVNCIPTRFAIKMDVILPRVVKALGGPAEIKDIQMDLLKGAYAKIDNTIASAGNMEDQPGGGITIAAGTGVGSTTAVIPDMSVAGFTVKTSNIILDLSPFGPDPSLTPGVGRKEWMGIYIGQATVGMPLSAFSKNGAPLTVQGKNCFIDASGFSGHIEAAPTDLIDTKVLGFQTRLTNLTVDVFKNSIIASDCSGTIDFGPLGKLDLNVNINDHGTTATVVVGQSLKFNPLGMGLSITRGSIHVGPDGRPTVWLDGGITLTIPDVTGLQNAVISFRDLGINEFGQFVVKNDGWINLDVPQVIDLGLLRCNLSSVRLRQVNNLWQLDLNGEISLNNYLPVTGAISFNELSIKPGPIIVAKGIAVNAEVAGLAQISGILDLGQDAYGKCLTGTANLSLKVGNKVTLVGSQLGFYIGAGGCWAVAGNGNLSNAMALTSGISIYKFHGGIAQGMVPKNGTNAFREISDLKPSPGAGCILTAACDIGTTPPSLFYCSGRMTATLPQGSLNMHGDAWIGSSSLNQPAPAQASLVIDPSSGLFRASTNVNLKLPAEHLPVLKMSGAAEIVFSPTDMHLSLGWPYPEKSVRVIICEGVPGLSFDARGGAYVSYRPNSPEIEFAAAAGFDFDYGIFSGFVDGRLSYMTIPPLPMKCLAGNVHAEGVVDFGIATAESSADLFVAFLSNGMAFSGEFCAQIPMPWPIPDFNGCISLSGSLP